MSDNDTDRFIRVPPMTRVTDTQKIPRYKEDAMHDDNDNWARATGRVGGHRRADDTDENEFIEGEDLKTWADSFKERSLSYMTATVMWFCVFSVLGIAGAFIIKLIDHIVGA